MQGFKLYMSMICVLHRDMWKINKIGKLDRYSDHEV